MGLPVHDGLLQIFDVKHGCCALLTMPSPQGTRRILIDCGHTSSAEYSWFPAQHLRMMGVPHIDALFVTNYDDDHASGFVDLLKQKLTIGCIYGNPTVSPETVKYLKSESGMGPGISALTREMALRRNQGVPEDFPSIPGLELAWCCNCYPRLQDENNLSLVVNLNILGFNFLFTGDMEKAGFKNLFDCYPPSKGLVKRTDVLMAAHHGRDTGIFEDMFDEYGCNPVLVVISDDYKQYASQETTAYYRSKAKGLARFRGKGPRYVLTTRDDKEIRFSFRNGDCFPE